MGREKRGNRTNHPTGVRKQEPTPRQRALALILTSNPEMSLGEAVVMAGYAESSRKDPRKLIVTKGVKSLRDAYLFEVSSKITPRIVAKRVQQGVKSPDLKVALEYIKEYKKDFGISTDTATNAIQINLTGDITDLAN